MAEKQPLLLADHVIAMKQAAQRHPQTVCLAAQVIGAVGKLSKVGQPSLMGLKSVGSLLVLF